MVRALGFEPKDRRIEDRSRIQIAFTLALDHRSHPEETPMSKRKEHGSMSKLLLRARERIQTALNWNHGYEGGQGIVEYALSLVLIANIVVVILSVVGHQISNRFGVINNNL
jgi:Flp pilus assembly pilin Flp